MKRHGKMESAEKSKMLVEMITGDGYQDGLADQIEKADAKGDLKALYERIGDCTRCAVEKIASQTLSQRWTRRDKE